MTNLHDLKLIISIISISPSRTETKNKIFIMFKKRIQIHTLECLLLGIILIRNNDTFLPTFFINHIDYIYFSWQNSRWNEEQNIYQV